MRVVYAVGTGISLEARASARAAGTNADVGHFGDPHIIGRTGQVLAVAVRCPDILDTTYTSLWVCCRCRVCPQEQPAHRQDTEQDGEQPGTRQELRSTYHVRSPSLQVGAAFTATRSARRLTSRAPEQKKTRSRRSRRSSRASRGLRAALKGARDPPLGGLSRSGSYDGRLTSLPNCAHLQLHRRDTPAAGSSARSVCV